MCNLYSITTNQEAIIRLFRVINRYVARVDNPRTDKDRNVLRSITGQRFVFHFS